uniref:Uncharacterized protein n=1 Tax=Solanum lycopersicum TaxID=4081 RepID=K4DFX8_SOLLC
MVLSRLRLHHHHHPLHHLRNHHLRLSLILLSWISMNQKTSSYPSTLPWRLIGQLFEYGLLQWCFDICRGWCSSE